MTYPQYQQPQGYAPGAPYAQSAPQQYAPAPQPQGQALAPPVPQLRDGSSGGGTPAPKFRHLLGRTIIVEPIRVDETAMDTSVNPPVNRPEAYFNLTVVDGGPVRYGDSQDRDVSKQRPNTHECDTPARWTNVNDRSYGFVQAVRDALNAGEAGRAGVVQQGTKGNKPYLITKCGIVVEGGTRPDGDARYAAAMAVFGQLWHDKTMPNEPRQFVNPEPRSLVAPPSAAPAQVAYGAPQGQYTVPQQYAPVMSTATGSPVVHQQAVPGYAQYVPQGAGAQGPTYGTAGGAPQYIAPTGPGGMYMPQSAPPAAPVAPAALPPSVEAWLATLPPELAAQQRAQFLAQGTVGGSAGPGI